MIYKLYSIRDIKANSYSEPFTAPNDEVAVRKYAYLMSKSEMIADDTELYVVGEFDYERGLITDGKQEFLVNYSEVKQ